MAKKNNTAPPVQETTDKPTPAFLRDDYPYKAVGEAITDMSQVKDGEIFLIGVHISPYENGNRFNLDPERSRKLLMHKREIIRLYSKTKEDGLTLVPTKCYFKDSKVKFEIGLARGKKNYDKRDTEAEKQAKRDIERAVKNRNNL